MANIQRKEYPALSYSSVPVTLESVNRPPQLRRQQALEFNPRHEHRPEIARVLDCGQPIYLVEPSDGHETPNLNSELLHRPLGGLIFLHECSSFVLAEDALGRERGYKIAIYEDMAATAVSSSTIPNMSSGNKRKRGNEDIGRAVKPANDETFSAALLQDLGAVSGDENTRTAQAALAGTMNNTYPDTGFDGDNGMNSGFGDGTSPNVGDTSGQASYGTPSQTLGKPAVGTVQWHQQRKDNHKEVERRRREVINDGIETIAKIVPGTEKNKGAILQRTAQYIQELQDQISKFETERATLDTAIKELTKRFDSSRESLKQAYQESGKWQQRCRDAGLPFDDYDGPATDFDGLNTADLDAIGS